MCAPDARRVWLVSSSLKYVFPPIHCTAEKCQLRKKHREKIGEGPDSLTVAIR
jgi:hypothetical protein